MTSISDGETGASVRAKLNTLFITAETIAALAADTSLVDGKYYTASSAFNGEPETFLYDADSTATADGALIVTASGMGAGRLVSTRTTYAEFDEMLGDVRPFVAGTLVRILPNGRVFRAVTAGGEVSRADGGTFVDVSGASAVSTTSPAYVQNLDTGLIPYTPDNVSATLEISVTGSKGSKVLTTAETSKVSGIGSTARAFEAALIPSVGAAFFASVLSNNGTTTITLREPLDTDFVGTISPKYDSALGQHLSQAGTKAFAAHLAKQVGAFTSRGRIMDGVWLDRPSVYHSGVWSKNAALTSYGVSNSAAPVVQSNILNDTSAANIVQNLDALPIRPVALGGRGISVGTHDTGHGIEGTIKLARRDAVVEFYTGAYRDATVDLAGTEIDVTVKADDVIIYDTSTDHLLRRHLISIHDADAVTIEVTNSDGGIYYIDVTQLTAREFGPSGKLISAGAKVATFGDSWFEFYDGLFASSLAALTGANVDNYALGGQTTEWALSWFNTYIKGKGYDAVVIHFYTNDSNDLSADTFEDPDGNDIVKWPSGFTSAEAKDHWRDNIKKLIALIQSEGAKPIVMLPCGTASGNQMQKHAEWSWHLDKSAPLDMTPVMGELTDSTSFLNNYGKFQGAQVAFGQGVFFAAGSDPSDDWGNPLNDALLPLQQRVLNGSDYSAAYSFAIGTDGDTDGLSDGISYLTLGTIETSGETYTPSIVDGNQRYSAAFTAGNTGQKRLKFDFSVLTGTDYLMVVDVINGPAAAVLEFFGNVDTGYTIPAASQRTLDGSGAGQCYIRDVADSTKTASILLNASRANGTTVTFDVINAYCIDVAVLQNVAPNIASMSDAEIAAFVSGML